MSSSKILNIEDIVKQVVSVNPNNPKFTIENIILAGKTGEMSRLIDQVFMQSGLGSVKSGITRSLYGVNFAGTPNAMPVKRDSYGLTFFTKPIMNMTEENLRSNRIMSQLLNRDANSIHRLIRCSLDAQVFNDKSTGSRAYRSPFVNPKSPFIPILSNNLLSMSGWPDYDSQTFTSGSGNWREEYSFVDGIVQDFRVWDATCSFRNVDGNIILNMFFYWIIYQACVSAVGDLMPYPVMNMCHEIDYNTAIYRILLDQSKTRVTGIARTIAFPLTCPIGAEFNFESDQVYNQENQQVSIQFRCHGAEYNDDILIAEFNRTVELMDGDFTDDKRESQYVLLPKALYRIFNGLAQPRINETTYELEWWVSNEDYAHYRPLLGQDISNGMRENSLLEQTRRLNPNNGAARS